MQELQISNTQPTIMPLESSTKNIPFNERLAAKKQRDEEFRRAVAEANAVGTPDNLPPIANNLSDQANLDNSDAPPTNNVQNLEENGHEEEDMGKIIPKKRFDKVLEKQKIAEANFEREREARIRAETELSLYNKALEELNRKQTDPVEQQIDPVDREAHDLYMRKIHEIENKYQQQDKALTQYQQQMQFVSTVNAQAAELTKRHPDFENAYQYLIDIEVKKAEMLGYDSSQSLQIATQNLQPMAWDAYSKGKNVAELTYNMAKAYGYKPVSANNAQTAPDLDRVSRNMPKSQSLSREVPGVSLGLSSPEMNVTLQNFTQTLSGKDGRGTNIQAFKAALEKLKANNPVV